MSMQVGENEVVGKSAKKSKRSKKIEMDVDVVEEIGGRAEVGEGGLGKVGKKSKKSKKKEMGGVEEMNDRTDVEDVELEQNLESGHRKKKKKSKGTDMLTGEESVNGESLGQFDTDNQPEKVQKKKKMKKKNKGDMVAGEEPGNQESIKFDAETQSEKVKKKKKEKRISVSSEEVTDCLGAVATEEASSLSLNKREKKLKNVHEPEVPMDSSPNDTQDEDKTVEKQKKKKTKRRSSETSENSDTLNEKPETDAKENSNVVGNVEKKKKKKRKRSVEEEDDNDKEKKNSVRGEDVENSLVDDGMVATEKIKRKKKRKNDEITDKDRHSRKEQDIEATNVSKKKEKTKSVDNDPNNPKSKEKKKVRFSDDVEVLNEENEKGCLVQGKRFTPEEDEILRAAVQKYIESHCLGENGLEMVLNCRSHRQVKNCWSEIREALPHRPRAAVYYRAHILFEGGERRQWTEEEQKMLLEHYKKHGNNWKMLAKEFKRHRFHVKDTWRRIRMKGNRGQWSQEEYQKLFDYVNIDLRAKVNEEKKSKHGMLRDNICWGAISDRVSTRGDAVCCMKWYNQLTSSMVAEGIWADADDYRLLDALFKLDACCIEDVDWDDLIDQRSGDVCRKRWDQMVLHIGVHKVKSFAEQVEVLSKRYCPELLEAREVWDNKPLVP